MKKPITVCAAGLGHPEGPYELDDGRVIFANSYASEIGVWDPKTGKAGTYANVGGGPNACMLGTDGCVYSTQTPNVGAWVAPESTARPRSRRRSPGRQGRDTRHRGGRREIRRAQRPHLRAGRAPLFHRFRRLGSRRPSRIRAASSSSRRTARPRSRGTRATSIPTASSPSPTARSCGSSPTR